MEMWSSTGQTETSSILAPPSSLVTTTAASGKAKESISPLESCFAASLGRRRWLTTLFFGTPILSIHVCNLIKTMSSSTQSESAPSGWKCDDTNSRRGRDADGNLLFFGPDGNVLNPGTGIKAHHHQSKRHPTKQEKAEKKAYRHWTHVSAEAWAATDGRKNTTERIRDLRAEEKETNPELHHDKLREQSSRWRGRNQGESNYVVLY